MARLLGRAIVWAILLFLIVLWSYGLTDRFIRPTLGTGLTAFVTIGLAVAEICFTAAIYQRLWGRVELLYWGLIPLGMGLAGFVYAAHSIDGPPDQQHIEMALNAGLIGMAITPPMMLLWYADEGSTVLQRLSQMVRVAVYLFLIGGALYYLHRLIVWVPTLIPIGAIDANSHVWNFIWGSVYTRLAGGAALVLLTLAYIYLIALQFIPKKPEPMPHGEARTATEAELRAAGLVPRKNGSIYVGLFTNEGRTAGAVGYNGTIHAITIGPNDSGKGAGLIIPNLASLPRSIFIIDPKGEAAAVTARMRARLGPVKIINPFNVFADTLPHLSSSGFNPLAALDIESDNFTDDCSGMAQALVREPPGGDGAFFGGSAQDLVTALIIHEKIQHGDRATLANVRTMLTEPFGGTKEGPTGLARTVFEMCQSPYAPLRAKAGRFRNASASTLDIISTAINETSFLDSPPLLRDLSGEAIDWDLMKREITTVYLILPADRLETHANFLRLVVTSALRSLLRSPPGRGLPPVLFMLDEFAQLGHLPPIENALGIARGFGVQLWPFLQDLNQLNSLYKDRWQTFIAARGVLTAFAPQDLFTADYLSKLCGQKTEIVRSQSEGAQGGGNTNYTPQGFPLFRPEKLMGMPPGQMLCFVGPVKSPFFTTAPGYWMTEFAQGLDPNPYYPR